MLINDDDSQSRSLPTPDCRDDSDSSEENQNLCIPHINQTGSQSENVSDREWKLQALLHMRQNHSMTYDGLSQFDMYLEEYGARKIDALKVQFLSE